METKQFLITFQSPKKTRWRPSDQVVALMLETMAEIIAQGETSGPVPAVTVEQPAE